MRSQVLVFQKMFTFFLIFVVVFLGSLVLLEGVLKPRLFEYAAKTKGKETLDRVEKAVYDVCGPLGDEFVVEKINMPTAIAGKPYSIIVQNNHAELIVDGITVEKDFQLKKMVNGVFQSSEYMYIYCNKSNVEIR